MKDFTKRLHVRIGFMDQAIFHSICENLPHNGAEICMGVTLILISLLEKSPIQSY